MAIVQIPVRSDLGAHEFNITIQNQVYHFKIFYNLRASKWNLSIFDTRLNPILQSIVLLTDTDVTRQFRHLNIPKGIFLVIDSLSQEYNPKQFDWNDRNYFLYNEAS